MGKLTARKVQSAGPGKYGDGNGLWLLVRANRTKSWVFRYMLAGRSREMGLGPVPTISLAHARVAATSALDRDCGDFSSWKEAQAFFKSAGPGDPHRLDGDGDGIACEGLR